MARLLVIAFVASTFAACASSGAVYTPQPFPVPGGKGTTVIPAPADAGGSGTSAPAPGIGAPVAPAAPVGRVAPAGAADGYALSGTAMSLRGAPYRDGGVDPSTGFDCSGFVQYVYGQYGVALPRQVHDQFTVGKKVDRDQLQPGDLVFFSTVAPGASHVGIMIGGDQFIHAPSERGVVRVDSLTLQYWATRFIGAKRVNPVLALRQ
jgi:cell wall-associated NlpC family hydrolase